MTAKTIGEIFKELERATDGRSKFATGRNHQFATRVTEDFHREFKTAAARDGVSMTVLLEKGLNAYLGRDNDQQSLIDHYQKASKPEKVEFLKWLKL